MRARTFCVSVSFAPVSGDPAGVGFLLDTRAADSSTPIVRSGSASPTSPARIFSNASGQRHVFGARHVPGQLHHAAGQIQRRLVCRIPYRTPAGPCPKPARSSRIGMIPVAAAYFVRPRFGLRPAMPLNANFVTFSASTASDPSLSMAAPLPPPAQPHRPRYPPTISAPDATWRCQPSRACSSAPPSFGRRHGPAASGSVRSGGHSSGGGSMSARMIGVVRVRQVCHDAPAQVRRAASASSEAPRSALRGRRTTPRTPPSG